MLRLAALTVMILFAGCGADLANNPGPVAPGTTIEIFCTADAASPNTKPVVEPQSKATIHLITPPVVETADIKTVAISMMQPEVVGGGKTSESYPALDIVLNETGTKKMLAATTSPESSNLAVVINGHVICVPKIVTPVSAAFRITGDHRNPVFLNAISTATGRP